MDRSNEHLRLREADIVWRVIEEEIVILHRGDWDYLTINQSGTLLFSRLAEGTTRAELVSVLIDEYGLDRDQASADVEAFLTTLADRDLLESGLTQDE